MSDEGKEDIYSGKEKIRNIGIIAHIDAGKTTVTERILYLAGEIWKIGKVHEGNTTTDFDSQERERGITIFSAAVRVEWKENKINLIDTPGHIDFTAEVERSLRVLDGGIVVLDSSKGVQAQTETVWRQANRYRVPRIIFLNKMDNADKEEKFEVCLNSIRERLGVEPLIMQIPIGIGKELKGVINIVEKKSYFFNNSDKEEKYEIKEIEEKYKEKVSEYRTKLIENIIEYDEKMANNYLENKEIKKEEIINLVRKLTVNGKKFPLFCGSAYKNIGVKLLLDGIVDYLPSPVDIIKTKGINLIVSSIDKNKKIVSEEKKIEENNFKNAGLLALSFKTVIGDYNNKLKFIRIYSGELLSNSYVYNSTKKRRERISGILRIQADKKEEIKKAEFGDIIAATGLENTTTGDTLCDEEKNYLLENIEFARPVISQAIEAVTNEDNRKLVPSLKEIKEQDPGFHFETKKETGEMIIAGMGELHLSVIVERLKREYGLKLNIKKQKVSYRESIENSAEIRYLHKKQTGGAGERAEVHMKFQPNPGKGFEFVDAIKGEDIPKQFRPSVKIGIENILSRGYLLGYPIVDVKATLFGGSWHPVDSSTKAFESAGYNSFKELCSNTFSGERLKFILLEPIMKINIEVPTKYESNIMSNLNSKRGEIQNVTRDQINTKIIAKIPLSEIFGYSTTLRSLTEGRGECSIEFLNYEKVPVNIIEKIREENN